jgi:hypothetical protein
MSLRQNVSHGQQYQIPWGSLYGQSIKWLHLANSI